jgi:type VI secretion system protein ImpK
MNVVDDLTRDCFNALIALRRLDESTAQNPERLQREIRRHIDRMVQRAGKVGLQPAQAQDMAYAIVALVDEIALSGPSELSQYWMSHMLQMAYFRENVAGEGFFNHLDKAKENEDFDVLRVYYTCLLFGFLGRYGVRGGERELSDIIAAVRYHLAKAGLTEPEALSPDADRPQEALSRPDRSNRLFWLPVGGLGLAIVLYVVLAATISSRASHVVSYIETFLK